MYLRMARWTRLVRCSGGAAVVGITADKMLRLEVNESGFSILSLCNGLRTAQDIVGILAHHNNMDDSDKKSVVNFLEQYISMHIVQILDTPGESDPIVVGSPDIILPISVGMEITSRCQLKCIHCFNSSGEPNDVELSVDDFIELVDRFVELGVVSFFITGGEPMLKPGIEKLIDRLGGQRLTVSMISNGVYLPEEALASLSKNKNITLRISIDGMRAVHDEIRGVPGAFEKAHRNIERLIKAGVPVSISFTLNDINRAELDRVACHFKEIGCDGIAIGVTSNAGRARENGVPHGSNRDYYDLLNAVREKYDSPDFAVGLDICEEKVKQVLDAIPYPNKCGAGYSSIAVRPNGTITPCTTMPNWHLGSVDQMEDTLRAENLLQWRNLATPTPELCSDCEQTMFCAYCLANMLESDVSCRLREGAANAIKNH